VLSLFDTLGPSGRDPAITAVSALLAPLPRIALAGRRT